MIDSLNYDRRKVHACQVCHLTDDRGPGAMSHRHRAGDRPSKDMCMNIHLFPADDDRTTDHGPWAIAGAANGLGLALLSEASGPPTVVLEGVGDGLRPDVS